MIFPNLEIEPVVQVNDRTRLSATKCYGSKGSSITKVEIEPDTGVGFIDVTGSPIKASEWYTDWQYDTPGTKTISLRVNDGSPSAVTITQDISVISAASDALFASDSDLMIEEPDILKWVKAGRNSFKAEHREAQKQILDMLDRKGYRKSDGTKISAADVVDKSEVREMAKYLALHIIFSGVSNQVGDVFDAKAIDYHGKYNIASQRQIIGLDLNGDSVADPGEGVNTSSARLIRG